MNQPGNGSWNTGGLMAEVSTTLINLTFRRQKHVTSGSRRCHLSIINEYIAIFSGKVHQHKATATNIAGSGQSDCQSEASGDCGIYGIASLFKHNKARLAGKPFRAYNHIAVCSHGHKAATKIYEG
jgi:hypothetical protein